MRRLLCTTRRIADDQLARYRDAWSDLGRSAEAAGCRVWLFRQAGARDRFLEFVEWQHGDDAPLTGERRALDRLFGPGESSEWKEAEWP